MKIPFKIVLDSVFLTFICFFISVLVFSAFIIGFGIKSTETFYTFPDFYFLAFFYFIIWFFVGLSSYFFKYSKLTLLGCLIISTILNYFLSDRPDDLFIFSTAFYVLSAYVGLFLTKKLKLFSWYIKFLLLI